MLSKLNTIWKQKKGFFRANAGRCASLSVGLLLIISQYGQAQVINNAGAQISVTSGIYVTSRDAENKAGGTISNNGNLNLTGYYLNNGTTSGNGIFRLGGNWTNTSVFNPGNSTVIFNGSGVQTITRAGGETFFNLTSAKTSLGNYLNLANDVTVQGTLAMSLGIIDAGSNLLYLSNQAASALNYTTGSGSRILGKFERGINQTAQAYLFPLGTTSYYNPANLTINSIITGGSVLSQFLTGVPGNNGLPRPDPPVEVADAFSSGFWRMTPNGFSTSNFNINLDAAGFTDTVRDVTRLIRRVTGGNWVIDGTHSDAVGTVVYRNNLTGDLDPAGTEFGLGRERPLVTVPPVSLVQCEHSNAIFSVTATGATPFKYQWYFNGSPITDGADYSGTRTAVLTVIDINLSDAGNYYCIIKDRYRNATTSPSASLVVMKNPVATPVASQLHACSNVAIVNIVFGLDYYDPGTTALWTRDNPAGISSAIPMSGTFLNIGDFISGSFDNTYNAPLIVTFTITPKGPVPTFCIGNPITVKVTVNPHPIADPLNNLPSICYGTSTDVVLNPGSTMTQGAIIYDFTVTTTDGTVTGNTSFMSNQPGGTHINRSYTNSSDTLKSVFFHITPKHTMGCPTGTPVDREVKVHAYTLQGITIVKPLTCDGGSDASVRVATGKGVGPNWITWQGPGPSPHDGYDLNYRTGLPKGRYDINVTDNLGCTSFNVDFIVISGAKLDPVIDIASKPLPSPGYQTSCWYTNDGEISIYEDTPSTGVAPFTYTLTRGTDTYSGTLPAINVPVDITGLKSGSYQLETVDLNGCKGVTTGTIIPPDTIKIAFHPKWYNGYNIKCKGDNDGSLKAVVSGGNGVPYILKWTTPDGSFIGPDNLDSIASVTAGTYYLTVTDPVSCNITKSFTMTEPLGMTLVTGGTKLSFTPDSAFNIACAGGNTGSIDITVNGGAQPYTFSWTDGASYNATTEDISNLSEGTYTVTVTDKNGCILKLPPLATLPSFGLTDPLPLNILSVPSTTPTPGYQIRCSGNNDGAITVTASGGSGIYQYAWSTSNGSGIVPGAGNQTTLTEGTYYLDLSDSYGCHDYDTVTLKAPARLKIESLIPTLISCASPLKNDGAINLTVSGGVLPYTYAWSNGYAGEDPSGLTAGNYSVTVTDANGCVATGNITLNLPPDVTYRKKLSDYHGKNVSCFGSNNGYIKIDSINGTAPYSFTWSNGATTDSIGGLIAGTYTVTIKDALECTATEPITLDEPGKLSMTIDLSSSIDGYHQVNCAGSKTGTIDVVPVNAVSSVRYIWSDDLTAASGSRSGLGAGDYTVIISDENFCHADSTVILSEPDSLNLSFSFSQPWCTDKPDGALGAIVTGGVPGAGYTYIWSDQYHSTSSALANILAGDYSVTVTDQNSCVISKSIELKPQHDACLVIPNAISPNGDAINDLWNIGEIDLYPDAEVIIYNRWGELLWKSDRGYHNVWDGTSNNSPLPIDSYTYLIDLHNGSKPIVGTVTIVR